MDGLFESDSKHFILTADGGSRGNPGPAAYGFVIWNLPAELRSRSVSLIDLQSSLVSKNLLHGHGEYIGETTNNQAEWQGVVNGLKYVVENYKLIEQIYVCLDSLLVINQLKGLYKVKNVDLKPWHEEAIQISKSITQINYQHIYREFNKEADRIVNTTLDALR